MDRYETPPFEGGAGGGSYTLLPDGMIHKYTYDADNRIVEVLTSRDGHVWDSDARYDYYRHGPLSRMEVGEHNLQGMDYAYTIHGWLKGVNSETLQPHRDIGKDGFNPGNQAVLTNGSNLRVAQTNNNSSFAKDVYGYALNYYEGDYKDIGTISNSLNFLSSTQNNLNLPTDAPDLFNGNIRAMTTSITNPETGQASPQLTAYKYDQFQV